MGRFSVETAEQYSSQQASNPGVQADWPTVFPKAVVGLDRDGTIIRDMGHYITSPSELDPLPGALDAIRMIRLKGHKLVILTNQAGITKGLQTQEQVDNVHNSLMQIFGQNGIFSIDGLFYSTSNLKEDIYAKPNIGMFNRAIEMNPEINWKTGWYVGDKISDLKAAEKAGATPVLVRTGHGAETEQKLNTFANRDLKKKTLIFDTLLDFANTL